MALLALATLTALTFSCEDRRQPSLRQRVSQARANGDPALLARLLPEVDALGGRAPERARLLTQIAAGLLFSKGDPARSARWFIPRIGADGAVRLEVVRSDIPDDLAQSQAELALSLALDADPGLEEITRLEERLAVVRADATRWVVENHPPGPLKFERVRALLRTATRARHHTLAVADYLVEHAQPAYARLPGLRRLTRGLVQARLGPAPETTVQVDITGTDSSYRVDRVPPLEVSLSPLGLGGAGGDTGGAEAPTDLILLHEREQSRIEGGARSTFDVPAGFRYRVILHLAPDLRLRAAPGGTWLVEPGGPPGQVTMEPDPTAK